MIQVVAARRLHPPWVCRGQESRGTRVSVHGVHALQKVTKCLLNVRNGMFWVALASSSSSSLGSGR